jgi:hypothetical protein
MQGRPAQTKQVRGVSPGFPVAAARADVGEPGRGQWLRRDRTAAP